MRKKSYLLFSIALLCSSAAFSQTGAPEIQFGHLSTAQGLSQNTIHCILPDHFGFLWFGTYNGLNKYDGYTFTVHNQNPRRTSRSSRLTNYGVVLSAYEDRDGIIWIGTGGTGLNRYDREKSEISNYRHDSTDPASLSNDIVLAIYEDHSGKLWIGTADGLNRFDRQNEQFIHYHANPADPTGLLNDQIQTIQEDHTGALWIGTLQGLYRYKQETWQFERHLPDPQNPYSLSHAEIKAIYEDHTGTLWIGTNGGGLNRFDRETGRFLHYRHRAGDPTSLSNDFVRTIVEDLTGAIWIGTQDGLNRFDWNTNRFGVYRNNSANPDSLSDNVITTLNIDRSGMLWIGTNTSGLNTYLPETKSFLLYAHNPNDPDSLSDAKVTAVYEDDSGVLWIGTEQGGLNVLNRQQNHYIHYRHDPSNPGSLSHDTVSAIYVTQQKSVPPASRPGEGQRDAGDPFSDPQGTLWVGTYSGLNRFDPEGRQFIHYTHDPANPQSLSHDVVLVLLQDHAGVLWIGTGGGGLDQWMPETGQFRHYRHDPDDPRSLSHDEILSLCEDASGVLWIGTFGGGLNALDPAREQVVRYRYDPQDAGSLSHDVVLALYADAAGTLWVGTSKGLDAFDRTSRTFTHYGEQEGLSGDTVLGILEDSQGHLWLSTLTGLAQFDPQSGAFIRYDSNDGLQGAEFTRAHFKSRDGELFFGGVNGLNAFFPEQIAEQEFQPPVVLTSLTRHGEPLYPNQAPETIRALQLDWRYNFFEFEFAALDYRRPGLSQYAYMLAGFDKGWIWSRTRRFGKYTNLPAGTYTLRIIGANAEGHWNKDGAALAIVIAPPPWKTWWAYALYILIPAAGLAGYVQYALKRRQLEESIRLIVEGTAAATGNEFFRSLSKSLASVLHVRYVLVAEYADTPPTKARTLAFWTGKAFADNMTYDLRGSLYKNLNANRIVFYPEGVYRRFGDDELVVATSAESYVRVPFFTLTGKLIGHLVILHDRPLKHQQRTLAVLKIFAARAEAELARYQANNALTTSLREKEILLKEVHHRVKNNLQIISSLLGMQAGRLQDPVLITAFKESQTRLRSMALIHEKLYQSNTLANIDFAQYMKDLGSHLLATYGVNAEMVTLNVQAEQIWLNIDHAIPCGMILNELISNVLKHAFPNGKTGTLTISLSANQTQGFTLTVQDTGVGLPPDLDIQQATSLGLKLVRLFTEQLDGTLTVSREGGATFTVTFPG